MPARRHAPHPAIAELWRDTVRCGDAARGWFDGPGRTWRDALPCADQARVATESLATTGRLLAVMSWLLHPAQQRADMALPALPAVAPPLAADHPLAGETGGEIARAGRALLTRAATLAAAIRQPI